MTDSKQTQTAEQNGTAEEMAESREATSDLASVIAERDDYLDRLQRSLAEFANYRRRVEQERARARDLATRSVISQLLPVMDDIQRALANVPAEQAETSWVQGVHFIEQKLAGLLEREGVEAIDAVGQPFDPAFHEAVATEDGSTQNVVVEVYQSGFKQGDHVLRPAMVKVGDRREFQA